MAFLCKVLVVDQAVEYYSEVDFAEDIAVEIEMLAADMPSDGLKRALLTKGILKTRF